MANDSVAEMMKFPSPASVAVMVCASDARSRCWSVFSLAESFLYRQRSVRQPPKACNMLANAESQEPQSRGQK